VIEIKTQKYLFGRFLATLISFIIIIINLKLGRYSAGDIPSYIVLAFNPDALSRSSITELQRFIDFYYRLILDFQVFLFVFIPYLIAETVAGFYWNRWRPVETTITTAAEIQMKFSGGRVISGLIHLPTELEHDQKKLIVISYGMNDSQKRAFHFAQALVAAGFKVLTWDYRGKGKNKGRITDFKGHIEDLKSIINFLSKSDDFIDHSLYLVGWSLGGMVSLAAGIGNSHIKKIFIWSTWSDLKKNVLKPIRRNPITFLRYMAKRQLISVTDEENKQLSPMHLIKRYKSRVRSSDGPHEDLFKKVFISHAENDKIVKIKNFWENINELCLPEDNYVLFKKGSHLMIRKKPILLALVIRFFNRDDNDKFEEQEEE